MYSRLLHKFNNVKNEAELIRHIESTKFALAHKHISICVM